MISGSERACSDAVRERDLVLARRCLRDDDALARIAIDGGSVHLRRRPACFAVARQSTPQVAQPPDRSRDCRLQAPRAQSFVGWRTDPSLAAALIFWARSWLALGSLTGASFAKSVGKCPKKSNSVRMRMEVTGR